MKITATKIILVSWAITTIFVAVFVSSAYQLPKFVFLMRQGISIDGHVKSWNEDDRILTYSYAVDGKEYISSFRARVGGDATYAGKPFPVTYNPEDPSYHLFGDVKANFNIRLLISIFFTLAPSLLFISIYLSVRMPPMLSSPDAN